MAYSPFYSAPWNIVVWTHTPHTRTKAFGVACWKKEEEKTKERKRKAQTSRSPKLMVHLALSEPLTGSSLFRGKAKVRRWEVNSGVTAYISLALQPPCLLLCPTKAQLYYFKWVLPVAFYLHDTNTNSNENARQRFETDPISSSSSSSSSSSFFFFILALYF